MICIIDYGAGNVQSVYTMLRCLTDAVAISNDPADAERASHLVLPGVGAFGEAMRNIRARGLDALLHREVIERKKPFLGICVGMQVLADEGEEFGRHDGLGWIPGRVEKLNANGHVLPHVGWNDLIVYGDSPLLHGLPPQPDFYFVHSYALRTASAAHVLAGCQYGEEFAAVVARDNIYGVQFHPEKSQMAGKQLLANFLQLS